MASNLDNPQDNRPSVTVLMAVFNGERHVETAIRSILAQTMPDFEFVIINDGSTDRSRDIINRIAAEDSRIILIDKTNSGLADSLNLGINIAKGGRIARMDADDISCPERLEPQLKYLDQHPEMDVLGSSAIIVALDGTCRGILAVRETHDSMARHILKQNPFNHPSIMAKKSVFVELNGYDRTLKRAQDYDLWLRGYKQFRFHNLQTPLMHYRMSGKFRWRDAKFSAIVILKALRRDQRTPLDLWFVLRPILAFFIARLGISKPHIL